MEICFLGLSYFMLVRYGYCCPGCQESFKEHENANNQYYMQTISISDIHQSLSCGLVHILIHFLLS